MTGSKSSAGRETLWLLFFLAIFFVYAFLMIRFVVPHHFNDRIAVTIAAIAAALTMIAVRAYADRSRRL